jgi:hypothetical protein
MARITLLYKLESVGLIKGSTTKAEAVLTRQGQKLVIPVTLDESRQLGARLYQAIDVTVEVNPAGTPSPSDDEAY